MNKLFACLALAFVAPIFGSLYAQEGPPPEQYEPPPPVGLDVDYLAPAKQKLSIGFRVLTGPKVRFSGSGIIPSGDNPTPDVNGIRRYNDGFVDPDSRTDASPSNSGQPLNAPGAPNADGRTNIWSYDSAAQVDPNNHSVDMHAYSGTINGSNPGSGRASSGTGFELTFERDFGWHLGRVQFDLIGGLGLNKISYSRTASVAGMMTTQTDVYNTYSAQPDGNGDPYNDTNGNEFFGGLPPSPPNPAPTSSAANTPGTLPTPAALAPIPTAPPAAPYTSPSSTTDVNGNTVDNSTVVGSTPVKSSTSQPAPTLVTEKWNINGAYFTMRAGAEMIVPITEKLSASVSGGPALVYVGTTFSVNQTLTPPTGSPITSTVSDDYNTVLPAYFADADIQYSFTDTTDLYLGAVFQSTTGYNQAIHSPNGNYTDKLEFGNQEGMRGGISFKF
ncbi:MAG TPA: hypothetical protein VNW30_04495 [Opitutaceae bacterium]|nr:hypothetical protein [Opitutaceae bacterium]